MLRHFGEKRTFIQNLRLAVMLCFTAGIVNAAGFFAFNVLTTNLTGHAALLAHGIVLHNWKTVRLVCTWLLLFLIGAFFTSWCIGQAQHKHKKVYLYPIILEASILVINGFFANKIGHYPVIADFFPGSLLFAMGMQNALVSRISGNVVRTTHLTGMFTDLGIDLYNVLQKNNPELTHKLKRSIILRISIIGFFLLGGIVGGVGFLYFQCHIFFLPATFLFFVLFYDRLRIWVRKTIYHWQH